MLDSSKSHHECTSLCWVMCLSLLWTTCQLGFVILIQFHSSMICGVSLSYGEHHTNMHISSSSRSVPVKPLTESQNSSYVGVQTQANISVKMFCDNFARCILTYSKRDPTVAEPDVSEQLLTEPTTAQDHDVDLSISQPHVNFVSFSVFNWTFPRVIPTKFPLHVRTKKVQSIVASYISLP
jgi:hypothetical protein